MDKYLSRQDQPSRADLKPKRRQPAPAHQLLSAMAPQRRTSPEIPESPQGSQESQELLGEDHAEHTLRVAPQSRSSSDNLNDHVASRSMISNRARPTEGEVRQLSDTAQQLIHYTGSEARRQIAFTRGQLQKAPVLNPYLLEMEKLRDHRPARGELPFNWQRAREEEDTLAQPVPTVSTLGGRAARAHSSSLVEGVRNAKISTTAPRKLASSALSRDTKDSKSKKHHNMEIMEIDSDQPRVEGD